MSCSTHWDNEDVLLSYNQFPLYPELESGYPKGEEIHHLHFTKDHNVFGFFIHGGPEYNSTIRVTKITKDGAADKDGQLRVRDIYL